jgi:sec-independent protein translocase protein TatA
MLTILAIGFPGLPEMLIVGLVVLLLFGSRLPSVMRSLGIGITEFKKGIKGEIDEDGNVTNADASLEKQDDKNSEDSQSSSRSTSSTSA